MPELEWAFACAQANPSRHWNAQIVEVHVRQQQTKAGPPAIYLELRWYTNMAAIS